MGFLFPFGRPGLYRIKACFGGGEAGGLKVTGGNLEEGWRGQREL